jgi:hypothetical protein
MGASFALDNNQLKDSIIRTFIPGYAHELVLELDDSGPTTHVTRVVSDRECNSL